MADVVRNYRYRAYPRRVQREAIDEVLGRHRELYIAALNFSSMQQTLRGPGLYLSDWDA